MSTKGKPAFPEVAAVGKAGSVIDSQMITFAAPIGKAHPDDMQEAQQIILASALVRPTLFSQVADVEADAFPDPRFRAVFLAAKALHGRKEDINAFSLMREIGDKREVSITFIAGIQNGTIPSSDLSAHREFLQEQRKIVIDEINRKTLLAMLNQGKPLPAILDAGRKILEQDEVQPARGKLAFSSAADLSAKDLSIPWLIKDFLPADAMVSVFGSSGCGKSFLALDWLLCIASRKKEWMGNLVKQRGPVFYVAGEGYSGLPRRIKAWCRKHSVSIESLMFFASNQAVHMLEPESVAEMVAVIDEMAADHGQPVVVCVDTLARCFGPGDENNAKDMSAFVSALDKIRHHYGCTVLVVHHSGLGDDSRSRGSSAFRAALDAEYRLSVDGETRVLSCSKAKDSDPPNDLHLSAEKIDLGEADEDGQPIFSLVFGKAEFQTRSSHKKLSANNAMALRALELIIRDQTSAHLEEWRKEFYSRSTADSQEAKRKAFERARKDLVAGNHINCRDDRYWTSVVPGQDRTKQDNVRPCPVLYPDRQDTLL